MYVGGRVGDVGVSGDNVWGSQHLEVELKVIIFPYKVWLTMYAYG